MKRISNLVATFAVLFAALGLTPSPANADETEDALKQSILQRVPKIDALKLEGKIGENNVGLLGQRASLSPDEAALMNAENDDRRALYTLLGKRLGLTSTVVGQGRGEELRKRSAPGVWVQQRNGDWIQTK